MNPETRAAQFGFLILEIATVAEDKQQDIALFNLNLWLDCKPEAEIREVIALVIREMPGHINHPTVVAMLEFLEGRIALMRMTADCCGGQISE